MAILDNALLSAAGPAASLSGPQAVQASTSLARSIFVGWDCPGDQTITISSLTYNGTAATSLGPRFRVDMHTVPPDPERFRYMQAFEHFGLATGTNTLSVQFSSANPTILAAIVVAPYLA